MSGKSCIFITEKMSEAAGASKKTSESQTAKALWAMNAAKDREEDSYDQARKDNMFGRNQTPQELWKEHLKDPVEAMDKCSEVFWRIRMKADCWLETLREVGRQWSVAERVQRCGTHRCGKVFGPILDP